MADDKKYLKLADKIIVILSEEKSQLADAIMALGTVIGFLTHYRNKDASVDEVVDTVTSIINEAAATTDKASRSTRQHH